MSSQNVANESGNVSLRRWRVMEVTSKEGVISRHVFGHDITNNLGRASSPIQSFDLETMTAITRSGKNYYLVGLPGSAKLGRAAWRKWCRDNAVASEKDVTDEYLNINQVSTVEFEKITNTANQ